MDRWEGKVAVVTGASSGIGSAIVKDLLKAGLRVVGLARRLERLEKLKDNLIVDFQENFYAIRCDVSNLESVNEAFDWICENLDGVDLLVNNAGMAEIGQLCQMELDVVQQTIQTNVMGVVYCTQRAFKSMKERNFNGHVVLINSVVGHMVIGGFPGDPPLTNIYCPSKFAVTAINEIFRQEFHALGTKIKVTSISPGLVNTDLPPEKVKEYMCDRILNPEDISGAVLYVIGTPPHVQIHELTIKPLGELL